MPLAFNDPDALRLRARELQVASPHALEEPRRLFLEAIRRRWTGSQPLVQALLHRQVEQQGAVGLQPSLHFGGELFDPLDRARRVPAPW